MHLRYLLLLLLFLLRVADVNGQSPTLTIDARRAPIKEVMEQIERQSGMSFSYDPAILEGIQRITLHAEDLPVESCLDRLFDRLPISYRISGRHIILRERPRSVTISGFIRDRASLEYLSGASVYEVGSQRGTATNSQGFFSLTLPAGPARIRGSFIGYSTAAIDFPHLRRDTVINILLDGGERLAEVIVTGREMERDQLLSSRMGRLSLTREEVKEIPSLFGENDVIKALQAMPGVTIGTEGMAGMYVRGGDEDENLYMLDEIPLYQVNHFGGLFSAFNTEALREVDFYKSAFPARYGGRLSSVLDARTKDGNTREYHGSATIGLTSGNLNLEGPIIKDRTSFNLSLRRSWYELLTVPGFAIYNLVQKDKGNQFNLRYAFTDLNVKVSHQINQRGKAFVNLYWGQDLLKLDIEHSPWVGVDHTQETDQDKGKIRWGNLAVSTGGSYAFSPKLFATATLAYTHYLSHLRYENNRTFGVEGGEDYSTAYNEATSHNSIHDIGLYLNFDYRPAAAHHIRYGSQYIHHRFYPEYTYRSTTPTQASERKGLSQMIAANELSLFAEDDWAIGSRLRINGGLRMNLYRIGAKNYLSLDPRVSTRLLLTDALSAKASYTRMRQYIHKLNDSYISLPTDRWMPVTQDFEPLRSDQVSLGLYYDWRGDYTFSVEGYHKWMDHLLDYRDGYNTQPANTDWQDLLTAGHGWAYGAELVARKERGKVKGWIGYGLMWNNRRFDEIDRGWVFPAQYDSRHKVNIVMSWKVSDHVELSGHWMYMTGNRVTLSLETYKTPFGQNLTFIPSDFGQFDWRTDYYSGRNNIRLPAYHRLDLGVNIYRPKKKGRLGIWNISVYNAYCHMNAISIRQSWGTPKRFETISLLPIIPSVSYTYKF